MNHTIIRLALHDGLGPVLIHHLIRTLAPLQWHELADWSADHITQQTKVSEAQSRAIHAALRDEHAWQRHQEWIARTGCRAITFVDYDYPSLLKTITVPPAVVWLRGAVLPRSYHACALVGAREATTYAQRAVGMLIPDLVAHNIITISGGARGVDASVHERTIQQQGKTVVVAGCGLEYDYPQHHQSLFSRIVEQGGSILSPFAPWIRPTKGTFPARNRVISGLAHCCVVVQAAARSGALITATYALEQNREVAVVPGPIDEDAFVGSNRLLGQGALPITDAAALLSVYDIVGAAVRPEQTRNLTEAQRLILTQLSEPQTFDDLCGLGHTDASVLQQLLFELEVAGIIKQNYAGFWERCE